MPDADNRGALEEDCPKCDHPMAAHVSMYDAPHNNYVGRKCVATIHKPARGFSYPCQCKWSGR